MAEKTKILIQIVHIPLEKLKKFPGFANKWLQKDFWDSGIRDTAVEIINSLNKTDPPKELLIRWEEEAKKIDKLWTSLTDNGYGNPTWKNAVVPTGVGTEYLPSGIGIGIGIGIGNEIVYEIDYIGRTIASYAFDYFVKQYERATGNKHWEIHEKE